MWFVLDHALALPEYLVEFDYITNLKSAADNKRFSDVNVINDECNNLFQGISRSQKVLENRSAPSKDNHKQQTVSLTAQDLDRSDMGCLKRSLHSFLNLCHIQELIDNKYDFVEDEKTGQSAIENSMPPEIPFRTQLDSITQRVITNVSRENELEKIVYLNLFNNRIKKIENLAGLVNLQTLILSFNEIDEINGLQKNAALKKLDLNHNFVKVIQNLESLKALTTLDLRYNWIGELDQVSHISTHCAQLKELGLKCNPLASKKNYRIKVFEMVSGLAKLDGTALTDKDKEQSETAAVQLTTDIIKTALRSQKKNIPTDEATGEESKDPWERQVEELGLSHLQIATITSLDKFINLRKLTLLDNNIAVIQGLESLKVLEELSLEKNKIQIIQNLENLRYLKKLDLGSNKIKRIANIQQLINLTQLSLENNEISRLDGLEEM
jgi:Leucine-rich repeat/Leucine Rich repeats (2 copies)